MRRGANLPTMRRLGWMLSVLLSTLATWLVLASLNGVSAAQAGPSDGLPKIEGTVDRATPRRCVEGFLHAAESNDFARAAHYLDLRDVPRGHQSKDGPLIAERLAYVVDKELLLDLPKIADTADGAPSPAIAPVGSAPPTGEAATLTITVGTIFLEDEPVPITLTRVRFDDGVHRWVVSRTTVAMVPVLYKGLGPHGFEDRLPTFMVRRRLLDVALWQWIGLCVVLAASIFTGWIVAAIVLGIFGRFARRSRTVWDDHLVVSARRPLRLAAAVMVLRLLTDELHLSAEVDLVVDRISFSFLVVGVAWLAIRTMGVGAEWLESRYPSAHPDVTGRRRELQTQLVVLHRVVSVVVFVVAGAVILLQFDRVRAFGVSLLASAGVVGIAVGFAAQKSLSAIIAGIQLSITQPIRMGDVVVLEGEQGTIEEINLTYILVRLWDDRRLVVPISRFLEQPFQNWTKVSADLLGTIMLPVDYACPVDRVRAELTRLCALHPKWDRRICRLRVIEVTDRSMTVRALVSSTTADDLYDLRCDIREQLAAFMSTLDGGVHLPRVRGVVIGDRVGEREEAALGDAVLRG